MAAPSLPKPQKRKLKISAIWTFARDNGYPVSNGVSPYDQASKALEKIGHPKECGKTWKAHCYQFADVIEGWVPTTKAVKKPKKAKAIKPKKHPKPAHIRRDPQSLPSYAAANAPDFLMSFEWRRVRMVALKQFGPRCQCCGATPADGAVMNVDHIKPRRIYPELALTVSNLQILCGPCNHGKGNWDMTDWRPAGAIAA